MPLPLPQIPSLHYDPPVPLLDTEQLNAMASGMPELLLPIVTDFQRSGDESLAKLRAALSEGRFADAKGILHQLKGASGTMGLVQFQNLCRECEEQVDAQIVPTRFGELALLLAHSVQGACAFLRGEQPPS